MKSASAIAKFINSPGLNPNMTYPKATVAELKSLKDACTSDEWTSFGKEACAHLGVEFEV